MDIKLLIIGILVCLILGILLLSPKKENYYVVSSNTGDYSNAQPTTSQLFTPYPENVFESIKTNQPELPTDIQIKQKYNACMQKGGTLKGCLSEASAGLDTNVCKDLCQQLINPLSPYCTSVCTEQMYQQRNSCAGGTC